MTLGKSESNSTLQTKFDRISFRNLKLATVAPYISAEYFSYPVMRGSLIMQTNDHQIVNYDLVLDAKFGKEGTSERMRHEEAAKAFYAAQLLLQICTMRKSEQWKKNVSPKGDT